MVYLLQDNRFSGTIYALCVVSMVCQYEPRIGFYRCLQFGDGKTEPL